MQTTQAPACDRQIGRETNSPTVPFERSRKTCRIIPACAGVEKVEIDYVEKKHVKKPKGGKPGFVVYYTNYSLVIDSDISNIKEGD